MKSQKTSGRAYSESYLHVFYVTQTIALDFRSLNRHCWLSKPTLALEDDFCSLEMPMVFHISAELHVCGRVEKCLVPQHKILDDTSAPVQTSAFDSLADVFMHSLPALLQDR